MKTSTPSRLTRFVSAALFSENTCLTVMSVCSAASFLCAVTGHEQMGALFAALMLPHFIMALRHKS